MVIMTTTDVKQVHFSLSALTYLQLQLFYVYHLSGLFHGPGFKVFDVDIWISILPLFSQFWSMQKQY